MRKIKLLMTSMMLLLATVAFAQNITVKGTITDEDGQPIPGAAVLVQGTGEGIPAGVDGSYSITVPSNAVLVFSSVGYATQEIPVNGRGRISVQLAPESTQLEETIFVAYGTQKKSSFTGSASTVDKEKLDSRPLTNVSKALDGQVAGVTVTSGTGQPGSGASIVIRGFGSVNASNTPLYVVDGIPYDGALNSISPQDIESITVLKDASAGALYGARGANGVVMITTKKGGEGRPRVSLKNTVGWSWRAIPSYDNVNMEDFVTLTYEALRNDYQYGSGYSRESASVAAMGDLSGSLGGEAYNPYKNYTWETVIDPATGRVRADAVAAWNEPWMDYLLNNGALRHEHELSVSGGTNRSDYLVSFGYLDEDGILKNTNFNRFSGRVNVNTQVNDWFKTGMNSSLAFTRSKYNQYAEDAGSSNSNVFYSAQFAAPIYPIYLKDAQGKTVIGADGQPELDYGEVSRPQYNDFNPLGSLTEDRSYSEFDNASVRTYVTLGSDKDSFGFAKGLKLTANFGADYRSGRGTEMMNKYHGNQANSGGLMDKSSSKTLSYTFNQLLTWNRALGNHHFDILGGHEFYNYSYQTLGAQKNQITDGIDELDAAAVLIGGSSYSNSYAVESWLARANYDFADKYYLSFSARADGSSRFYKDNRWGSFWSVGANWRVSAESFMQNLSWLDNLNVKASYGEQGNDSIGSLYAWQNLYNLGYTNGYYVGAIVSTLENKKVSWEKNANFNVGFDASLFGHRVNIMAEYYNRLTKDMLLEYPMALSTGFSGYYENVGNVQNQGVEITLGVTPVRTRNIQWDIQWMGSTIANKVLKLTKDSNQIISGIYAIKEGMPMNTFYLAKSAGVDPQTGAPLYWAYESMDDKGVATGEYITDDYQVAANSKYFQGSRLPDLYGSLSTSLNLFNCIDFSVLTTYSIGGKIYDGLYAGSMEPMYVGDTFNKNALRRWQNPGDITDIARVSIGASDRVQTDLWLIDASYFAIKNITLGYTLPKNLLNKVQISSVRVYASVDNLAMFCHLDGMNPQANFSGSTGYSYTPNKTVSVGIDINF